MSTVCGRCGATNTTGARFCNQCSASLTQVCPACGQSHPTHSRFCNVCGQPLAAPLPHNARAAAPLPNPLLPNGLTGRLGIAAVLGGRYRVMQKLGQGGMGAVYLVTDQRLANKQYALKEMTAQTIPDPADRQAALLAFQQEAELLAHLDHPNLPKVTDTFAEGGNQYLVMEFVQGEPLEKKLAQAAGPLPEPQVRRHAEQLCDVLDYLHRRQPPVIFRDLKPANIMVLPDGRLKLIDFGIARHFKPGKSSDTQAMGTPGYAAPEQYGKGQSDARTDVYALGATLHHMLTGRDPSSDPFQFPSARLLNPLLSNSIDQIVERSVRLDPGQRWQSMRDLQNALLGQAGATAASTFVSSMPAPTQMAARTATQSSLGPIQPVLPPSTPPAPTYLPAPVPQPVLPPMATLAPYPGMASLPGMPNMPPGLMGTVYAGYGKRVGAYIVDAILFTLMVIMLMTVTGIMYAMNGMTGAGVGTLSLLLLAISSFFYFIWPTAGSGKTLGKRAMGIKVVDNQGAPPGMTKALLRYVIGFGVESFLMYFMVGLLGWLWPLWDANKQAWHDKIGGTYVVEK